MKRTTIIILLSIYSFSSFGQDSDIFFKSGESMSVVILRFWKEGINTSKGKYCFKDIERIIAYDSDSTFLKFASSVAPALGTTVPIELKKRSAAVNQMLIYQKYEGFTSFTRSNIYYDEIWDFDNFPQQIRQTVSRHLSDALGTMADQIQFSHGQVIDLEKFFIEDSTALYREHYIIPKYCLNFILTNDELGIKRYYIKIQLDEYGQLLEINWPRLHHNNKEELLPTKKVEQFALTRAKDRGLDTSTYRVKLAYNETFNQQCWVFYFDDPSEIHRSQQPGYAAYHVIEISMKYLKVVEEHKISGYNSL